MRVEILKRRAVSVEKRPILKRRSRAGKVYYEIRKNYNDAACDRTYVLNQVDAKVHAIFSIALAWFNSATGYPRAVVTRPPCRARSSTPSPSQG